MNSIRWQHLIGRWFNRTDWLHQVSENILGSHRSPSGKRRPKCVLSTTGRLSTRPWSAASWAWAQATATQHLPRFKERSISAVRQQMCAGLSVCGRSIVRNHHIEERVQQKRLRGRMLLQDWSCSASDKMHSGPWMPHQKVSPPRRSLCTFCFLSVIFTRLKDFNRLRTSANRRFSILSDVRSGSAHHMRQRNARQRDSTFDERRGMRLGLLLSARIFAKQLQRQMRSGIRMP